MPAPISSPGSRCPACGGSLGQWRRVPASDPALANQSYELLRCADCGSAVTAGEAPADLYESGSYNERRPRLYSLAQPVLESFDRRRLNLLQPLVTPPARLLDVGTGRGRFVASALAAGYRASGIEPSARGVSAAAALEVPVQQTSIEQAQIEAGELDAAVLWHVLEHLDDPGSAITRIRTWLKPGGALLIGVPNLASTQARLGGERWFHLDVPRHRVHFTPKGLHRLLNDHELTVIRTDHLLAEHNAYGMWQSLVNRLTAHPSYLYNLLKRNAPLRSADLAITLAAIPMAPPAALAELLAGARRRGGTIAVLAQRRGYH